MEKIVISKMDGKKSGIERFTAQKAVKIRSAEGRSASASAQTVAANALKARYAAVNGTAKPTRAGD